MFVYYLDLALRSLKRNPMLTALMILAIAVGIGASMTTLTVLHVLSGDPLPQKSSKLYYPQIDPRGMNNYRPGEEPMSQVSWIDGMNLLRAKRADRQALMTGGRVAVQPDNSTLNPFYEMARYTTAGFFPMFDVPFRYGHPWNAKADEAHARVVVISAKLNDRLFGGRDSTGRTLHLGGHALRIVGVLGDWHPEPHFYDLTSGSYDAAEGIYLPLSTSQDLRMEHIGNNNCWGNGGGSGIHPTHTSPCAWLQFWVQLDTLAKAAAYKQFLIHYSEEQKTLGRFKRPPNVRLRNLMQWLDYNQVVPNDIRLQTWLALGFLLVCLVNTVGLMLAKFMRRAGELGVRRALGASQRALFAQLLVESGVIGLAGGLGGLLLAFLGLWIMRQQDNSYAALAHLDPVMLAITFVLAVGASLLAGMLPAVRACRVTPALQLKSN